MRIIEKILYGIGGILAILLLFVALCHYAPNLASKIGGGLKADSDNAVGNAAYALGNNSDTVGVTVTSGELPAAEEPSDSDKKADDGGKKTLYIPNKVAALNGYIPVKSTATEVTQTKADEILSTLSVGKTGAKLAFNTDIYPYYGMLENPQKELYKQIYANADALIKNFAPIKPAGADYVNSIDLKNAFTAVVNDHPELFWVDTAYKYKYSPKGQIAEITLAFNLTATDIDSSKAQFAAAAKLITDETYGLYTDYDKEKKVHNELIGKVRYDANAPINQSAYSALVYGRTVCAGYARAFQYLMQQLDIPCYYVTGYAGENHAWNIVKLDDGYYNVDSTWDDTNPNTYDYFNCSDADYATDHMRTDLSVYLPPCNGNKYSGLEVNPPADTVITGTTGNNSGNNTAANNGTSSGSTQGNSAAANNSTAAGNTVTNNTTANSATSGRGDTSTSSQTDTDNGLSITVETVRWGDDGNYIANLDDYYIACFEAMMESDSDNISFGVVVSGADFWEDIYDAYENGDVQEGFIERYLVEKHRRSCNITARAVPQSNGTYLIVHNAVIAD